MKIPLFILLLGLQITLADSRSLYIAVDGRDDATGALNDPLATPETALKKAAEMKEKEVTLFFRSGSYFIPRTLLWENKDCKLTLQPFQNEQVRLTGGRIVEHFLPAFEKDEREQAPAEVRNFIFMIDLRSLGISDYGSLTPRGFGRTIQPSPLELYYNNRPLTLARWPNDDWAVISDTLAGQRQQGFVFNNARLHNWLQVPDLWLHGYWTWDWADSYEKVQAIDTMAQRIITRLPGGVYGYMPGKRFYVLNALSELDAPGEYYVDRENGLLYFWPPEALQPGQTQVSVLSTPLIHLKNVNHVTIQGLTLECGRSAGVIIEGGSHNLIRGCTIRNMGTVGVCIGRWHDNIGGEIGRNTVYNGQAGHHNGLTSCDIYQCGEGGVILTGGDRKTLTPGNNYVDNCHFYDVCRWVNTYRAAVFMWGVGNRVSHCLIHDLPHSAVFFWGNDHLLEYNEIYKVCQQTGDAGAFYIGRDWSQRGSVIQYNYFHDLHGVEVRRGFVDVMAVYLDDLASGTTVYGNVFDKAGRTVMIGGGRDNRVENNVILNGTPALHVDGRGRGWAQFFIDGPDSIMHKRLNAVDFRNPPYAQHYPELAQVLTDQPGWPKGNTIKSNIICAGKYRELLDEVDEQLVLFRDNFVSADVECVQIVEKKLRIPKTIKTQTDFKDIPFHKIGLYKDRFRP